MNEIANMQRLMQPKCMRATTQKLFQLCLAMGKKKKKKTTAILLSSFIVSGLVPDLIQVCLQKC